MKARITALLAGVLFGLGLAVSQMINPQKVQSFLDVFGQWDPSLALVMLAAVAVSFAGFRFAAGRDAPLLDTSFHAPSRRDLDGRLLTGAAIFGIGWGLAGYCPGPAISALALSTWEPLVFLVAMAAGSLLMLAFERKAS